MRSLYNILFTLFFWLTSPYYFFRLWRRGGWVQGFGQRFGRFSSKVKQAVTVRTGVEQELSKRIVRVIKDSKLKVQASIQGDAVRVTGAKRDELQNAIALVKKSITDFPLQFSNFRD
jgi:uncharacterized protein YajQ (UPF0234 family)